MVTHTSTYSTGTLEIPNLPKCKPFSVDYEELDDAIQADIAGIGIFRYFDPISPDLQLEISTNINNKLVQYQAKTGHNASEIGYSITYTPKKKLNTDTNTLVMGVQISLFFKKPVVDATAYSLQPTIKLISMILLNEIVYLKANVKD